MHTDSRFRLMKVMVLLRVNSKVSLSKNKEKWNVVLGIYITLKNIHKQVFLEVKIVCAESFSVVVFISSIVI